MRKFMKSKAVTDPLREQKRYFELDSRNIPALNSTYKL